MGFFKQFALIPLLVAGATSAAVAQESVVDTVLSVFDNRLGIAPMDCAEAGTDLGCIAGYLESVQDSIDPFMEQQLEAIREKVKDAEEANERFDGMIEIAVALQDASVEGGAFSIELDRIGALIQSARDRASSNENTKDLVPRFEAELERWQNVRTRLLSVNEVAGDLKQALEAGRDRVVLLLELQAISDALSEAEQSLDGMEAVIAALDDLHAEATREVAVMGTD